MRYIFLVCFSFLSLALASQEMRLQLPVSHHTIDVKAEFSSNNRFLLTREDNTVILWDVISYRPLRQFHKVEEASFSDDGGKILLNGDEGIRLFDPESSSFNFHLPPRAETKFSHARLSKDNRILYFASTNTSSYPNITEAVALEITGSKELFRNSLGADHRYSGQLLTPDHQGKLIAKSDYFSTTVVFDGRTGKELYSLPASDSVWHVEFSRDNRYLLAVLSSALNLYDAASGKLVKSIKAERNRFASFSYDSKKILVAGGENHVRIYNVGSGSLLKKIESKDPVYKAYFSPTGKYIIQSLEYNWLAVIEAATGEKINDGFSFFMYFGGPRLVSPDEKVFYGGSKILQLANGEEIHNFEQALGETKQARLSPDGKLMAYITELNNVSVWDLTTASLVVDIGWSDTSRFMNFVSNIEFASDSQTLFIGWSSGEIWKWDCKSNRNLAKAFTAYPLREILTTRDRSKVLVVSDSTISLLNASDLRTLFSFRGDQVQFHTPSVKFSHDETLVLANSYQQEKLMVIDAVSGSLVREIPHESRARNVIGFPGDGKVAIISSNKIYIHELQTGKSLGTVKNEWSLEFEQHTGFLDEKGDYLFISSIERGLSGETPIMQMWNLENKKLEQQARGLGFEQISLLDSSVVTQYRDSVVFRDPANFLPKLAVFGKQYLVDPTTNRVFVRSEYMMESYSTSGRKIASFVSLGIEADNSSYTSYGGVIILPDNYYKADRHTVDRMHFVSGSKVIGVNQIDLKLNRPDIVLATINKKDSSLIGLYHAAYFKRIQRTGFNPALLENVSDFPEADIANRNSIKFEQLNEKLVISLSASDRRTELDRYNVWVNDVPVFGSQGVSIAGKKTRSLKESLTITLSKGMNIIEFSVTNKNGLESFRKPLRIYRGSGKSAQQVGEYEAYDPNAPKEKIYFIGIGIDKYQQEGHDLQWSVKDIRDLAGEILAKGVLKEVIIDTLFNENATLENILALKKKLQLTGVDDKVIVAFSGHGLLSDSYDYYLSTYHVNFSKPEKGGLAYHMFEELLDNIPSRKKLVLIDACHSGELDKEEMSKIKSAEKSLAILGTKSNRQPLVQDGKTGMQNSFQLMQQFFSNVAGNTGATIISAAGGMQFAQERATLQNGVFTFSVLEFLKNSDTRKVSDLQRYVNKRVAELTDGLQVPTTRSEVKSVDWAVW